MLFNGDSNELFVSIHLQRIYDTYLKGIGEDTINSLFDSFDNEEQKSQLLLSITNMEISPNYAQSILDNYDSTQWEALTEVLRKLETSGGLNTNGYYYEASDNMFNNIYNLYETMYNINQDTTISDIMDYIKHQN